MKMSLGFMILFFILFNSDQAMVWVVLTVLYIYTVGTEKYFPISPIPCPSLSLLTSFTFRFSSCTFPSNHWFWAHIQHSLCFYSCTQAIPSPFHSCQPFCYTQYLPDLFFVFFFSFLGPHLQHMEVPRLVINLELYLPAYTTSRATRDLNCIYNLYHLQCQILIPLSSGIKPTYSWILVGFINCWAMKATPFVLFEWNIASSDIKFLSLCSYCFCGPGISLSI